MTYIFRKYPYKGIKNERTGQFTNPAEVKELLNSGKEVIYVCSKTGNNLLHEIEGVSIWGYGSAAPLLKPKMRKCARCGAETANRFRCSDCWDYNARRQHTVDLSMSEEEDDL